MNQLLILLFLVSLIPVSRASELEFKTAFLPLYVDHAWMPGQEDVPHSKPRKIQFVSRGASPETKLSRLSTPFVPHHDKTWHRAGDANLVSLCGFKISHDFEGTKDGKENWMRIFLDTSAFEKPKTVRISDDQILELVKKAIAMNFPQAVLVVRETEEER